MLKIWLKILQKFNAVNHLLQKSDLNLSTTVNLYQSLVIHTEDVKNNFDYIFEAAKSNYLQLDAEKYVSFSRGAITLPNMDDRKQSCHDTLFAPVMNLLTENLKLIRAAMSILTANFHFWLN